MKHNFAALRTTMVDGQIHTSGVVEPAILRAFETIPRELFVPEDLKGIAYSDEGISIGGGRFLMEPMIHAKMVQAAAPHADDIVLDVGCGSGYSAAVFSPLVSTVVALESSETHLSHANKLWNQIDACNIISCQASLNEGCDDHAPYSLIFLNGAADHVPESLFEQLAPEGRLVAIIKEAGHQLGVATLFKKSREGAISSYKLFDAGVAYFDEFKPSTKFTF